MKINSFFMFKIHSFAEWRSASGTAAPRRRRGDDGRRERRRAPRAAGPAPPASARAAGSESTPRWSPWPSCAAVKAGSFSPTLGPPAVTTDHVVESGDVGVAEAEDDYPDDTAHEPQRGRQGQLPMTPRGGGRGGHDPRGMDPGGGGYIKYNSFANY